jgi:hypothetical protein
MLKQVIEYILALHNARHLTNRETNLLLGKIRDNIHAKHSGSMDEENNQAHE